MNVLKRLLHILGAYICTVLFMVGVEITFDLINGNTISIGWNDWMITAAILVGTQALFVLPLVRPPKTALYGKSLTLSFIFAALIASLCTTALAACMYSIVVTIFLDAPQHDDVFGWMFGSDVNRSGWGLIGLLSLSWVVWSFFLLIYVRRGNKDARLLVRWTSWLFAGSLIEFLLSIPLTIMVSRRSDCYCETGSFIFLSFSLVAAIWLFGPFMVILLIWRKRPWCKDHCAKCGYPRQVRNAEVCSECGAEFYP